MYTPAKKDAGPLEVACENAIRHMIDAKSVCLWSSTDETGYTSGCGQELVVADELSFEFCPFCGARILLAEPGLPASIAAE